MSEHVHAAKQALVDAEHNPILCRPVVPGRTDQRARRDQARLVELVASLEQRARPHRSVMNGSGERVRYLSPSLRPGCRAGWPVRISNRTAGAGRSSRSWAWCRRGNVRRDRPASSATSGWTQMDVLIVGPPGSGKGTKSLRVSRALVISHISTGELLREAIRLGTPLGDSACECVAAGRLVPDAVVNELVGPGSSTRRLAHGIPARWFSPERRATRRAAQLAFPAGLDAAIELVVPNDVVERRLTTWTHRRHGRGDR